GGALDGGGGLIEHSGGEFSARNLARAILEHALKRGCRRALARREVAVARGQSEAVLLAHGRNRHDLHRQIEVFRQPRHHLELLVILLAEHRDVGRALDQKFSDHGRHAAEEMRATLLLAPPASPPPPPPPPPHTPHPPTSP